MANQEHLAILREGVDIWNSWREKNRDVKPDLSKAELRALDLGGVDLTEANLMNANLEETNLTKAYLGGAKLIMANLSGAELSQADLRFADIRVATLKEVNLSGARLGYTVLSQVDLQHVNGVGAISHEGPSNIGFDTIIRLQLQGFDEFLYAAGVPRNFINIQLPLQKLAFCYPSCFISYSTKDRAFAEELCADLMLNGVYCWHAPEQSKGGYKFHEQLVDSMRFRENLVLVMSETSMSSNWMRTEILRSRKQEEKNDRQMLFPIRLVSEEKMQDWLAIDISTDQNLRDAILEYDILDFSDWGETVFWGDLEGLLNALQESEESAYHTLCS